MATTYSFAMMIMMITMALAKEPVGIRIKDAAAVIAFGNPPDIRIRRMPDPKWKEKSTLVVEAQSISINGRVKGAKSSVALNGDLVLNGKSLAKSLMNINKRLIQIATTVNDLADKAKVKGVAKLPVEDWKKEHADKPSAAQCAKLSVSQCKTTKLPCSWDNGKCMMKKPDPCAKLKADVCEKQKKLPCSYDAKAKKCMMKKPADACAKFGAKDCSKQTKLSCSWDKGKCMMKKKPEGKGKTTGKPKGGAKGGADCKKFNFQKCGKSKESASCGWDGGECKPKKGGKK